MKLQTIRSGACSHPALENRVCANRSLHLCPWAPSSLDTAARSSPGPSDMRAEVKGQDALWHVPPAQGNCERMGGLWYPGLNREKKLKGGVLWKHPPQNPISAVM